jgi:hypothetical protein
VRVATRRRWQRGGGQKKAAVQRRQRPRAAPKKEMAARAAARRGAATPRVSTAEKSDSDYHVSGEGLPRNWMIPLMGDGLHL